ncbi:ghrB [Symbiodinium pilosum]|uniref:GhrB protein n=1 Tax=Symbiodinium pilosum TaxID=2952 RepID=A0A812STN1_SYMPI|nr:ghrB [Symbiodinium pilosum]
MSWLYHVLACGLVVSVGAKPVVLVYEMSAAYLSDLANSAASAKVEFRACETHCAISTDRKDVIAAVGMPRNFTSLYDLPNLKLIQSTTYMYPRLSSVPARPIVAKYDAPWRIYGVEPIAEFVVAAAFQWTYKLAEVSSRFRACAFGSGAPGGCAPDSALTAHPTLMSKTMGILGYGTIGEAVGRRAFALGMRVLATRRHGPFSSWLIDDNDKLLAESDFVAVTVPGSVFHVINRTALALMKPGAVLIPISSNPVDFDALYQALLTRRIGAVLDVWPQGCWHYPDSFCGPPYGPEAQPYLQPRLAELDNVLVLPGLAMRDSRFWSNSAVWVSDNLVALMDGMPLKGVVRNASVDLEQTEMQFV